MVNLSNGPLEYLLGSIRSVYKALLLNIGKGMIQNKTTDYNKK